MNWSFQGHFGGFSSVTYFCSLLQNMNLKCKTQDLYMNTETTWSSFPTWPAFVPFHVFTTTVRLCWTRAAPSVTWAVHASLSSSDWSVLTQTKVFHQWERCSRATPRSYSRSAVGRHIKGAVASLFTAQREEEVVRYPSSTFSQFTVSFTRCTSASWWRWRRE